MMVSRLTGALRCQNVASAVRSLHTCGLHGRRRANLKKKMKEKKTPQETRPGHLRGGWGSPAIHHKDALSNRHDEPELSAEQQHVVELAAAGHNIFYTGSAGCGKSTVLNAIRERLLALGNQVHVMAPTGRVAIANGGTTTWSFAGWTPNSHKKSLWELRRSSGFARKRLRNADTIIIDEISMVENLHFQRLSEVMKAAHLPTHDVRRAHLPFGGTQVIVTGDFCQLPPVRPFRHCIKCGSDLVPDTMMETYTCHDCDAVYHDADKWAFRSKAWEECNFHHVHLETIHRQRDPRFVELLEKCRLGSPFSNADVELLTRHDVPNIRHAVKLYCTREEVRRANNREFRRLQTSSQKYKCLDLFSWNEALHPYLEAKGQASPDESLLALKDHSFERQLDLKEGMLVMLLTNIDLSNGLCNGAQGIVTGFEPFDGPTPSGRGIPDELPIYWPKQGTSLVEAQMRKFTKACGKSSGWPIVKFHNGLERTIYPDCQINLMGDERPYSVMARTQIPLAPAWALSVHKSQGMTLDKVVVDLRHAFEEGQVYVALSRAKSLEGLKVEGDPGRLQRFQGNKQVMGFLREKFGEGMAGGRV